MNEYPQGTVRVVLEGDIFDGEIQVYNMDGDNLYGTEEGYDAASVFMDWPERLAMLSGAGEEGIILTPAE